MRVNSTQDRRTTLATPRHVVQRPPVPRQIAFNSLTLTPSTAEWPGMFDGDRAVLHADCTVTYRSWVDAQNGFGAKLRTHFLCSYDPKTDLVSVSYE